MHGIIALDIDGTLTNEMTGLPVKTLQYLTCLAEKGWQFVFVTGRPYMSGIKALKDVSFPYYLAVQNGSIIFEAPKQSIIAKKYLDRSIFLEMDAICEKHPTDFVIYGGFEHQDHCFYRPHCFSSELSEYLQRRISTYKETWHAVESFDNFAIEQFPSIKCFGLLQSAKELAAHIEQRLGLHVPVIRDPFGEGKYYVIQATHPQISKGQAVLDLITFLKKRGKVIAAGDDYNDISMLEIADVSIAMGTAPQEMLEKADIVAPPATEEGIIIGLEAAIKLCEHS